MKYAIWFGLLIASTWVWTLSPHPRPSVEGYRKTGEIAQNTQPNQGSPTVTPSPVSADSADGNKHQTGSPQADNGKGSEGVHSVEPLAISTIPDKPLGVSTVKDGWDKALTIGTVLLVLVGGFQIWFLWRTVIATRDNATAALLNATVLLESQRAKITAIGIKTLENIFQSDIPRIEIGLSNKGMTTAYDCIYETWTELLPAPFDDFTSSAQYFKSPAFALYPDAPGETVINIPLKGRLTQAGIADIAKGNKLLCVRICVRYRDFKEGRFSNFGYFLRYDGFGFLPKYNDCN